MSGGAAVLAALLRLAPTLAARLDPGDDLRHVAPGGGSERDVLLPLFRSRFFIVCSEYADDLLSFRRSPAASGRCLAAPRRHRRNVDSLFRLHIGTEVGDEAAAPQVGPSGPAGGRRLQVVRALEERLEAQAGLGEVDGDRDVLLDGELRRRLHAAQGHREPAARSRPRPPRAARRRRARLARFVVTESSRQRRSPPSQTSTDVAVEPLLEVDGSSVGTPASSEAQRNGERQTPLPFRRLNPASSCRRSRRRSHAASPGDSRRSPAAARGRPPCGCASPPPPSGGLVALLFEGHVPRAAHVEDRAEQLGRLPGVRLRTWTRCPPDTSLNSRAALTPWITRASPPAGARDAPPAPSSERRCPS